MTKRPEEARIWINPGRLSLYDFSQACPDGFRGLSSGIPKTFIPYVPEISLSQQNTRISELENALRAARESLGWYSENGHRTWGHEIDCEAEEYLSGGRARENLTAIDAVLEPKQAPPASS